MMTQWERAVEAAASEIFDEGVFDVDGAETEEKAYCREVAAAALRAALLDLCGGIILRCGHKARHGKQ